MHVKGNTMTDEKDSSLLPMARIERAILLVRGQKVMLDSDLAELYGVETKLLNQAVKRHIARFPGDFMFQLTRQEFADLKSQSVTSSSTWGGRRYAPYAFAEQGVAVLSSVLRVPSLSEHRNVREIIALFGGTDSLRSAIEELQSPLYAAQGVGNAFRV